MSGFYFFLGVLGLILLVVLVLGMFYLFASVNLPLEESPVEGVSEGVGDEPSDDPGDGGDGSCGPSTSKGVNPWYIASGVVLACGVYLALDWHMNGRGSLVLLMLETLSVMIFGGSPPVYYLPGGPIDDSLIPGYIKSDVEACQGYKMFSGFGGWFDGNMTLDSVKLFLFSTRCYPMTYEAKAVMDCFYAGYKWSLYKGQLSSWLPSSVVSELSRSEQVRLAFFLDFNMSDTLSPDL